MKFWYKYCAIALVGGAIGGLATYGGISHYENTGYHGGLTHVERTANVQSQSEKAFKSVRNDVVSVINMQKVNNEPISGVFNNSVDKNRLQAASEGSGVVYRVSGDNAYLVTNEHVVNNSNKIRLILSNHKKVNAKVVGTSKKDDLAVLKCSSQYINHAASFGDSDDIQAGETSLAIGSPLGATYASTVTKGIISNKNRKVKRMNVNNPQDISITHVIQTDSAINPGNSGGPLINLNGQVIGINSAKVASTSQGTSVEGMGFAIPSNEVVHVINQIISKN